MDKHLDEVIHDLKIEANYMVDDVDVDEIINLASFHKHLKVIEACVELLIDAYNKAK